MRVPLIILVRCALCLGILALGAPALGAAFYPVPAPRPAGGAGVERAAASARSAVADAARSAAEEAVADTLRARVRAGEPLIVALPAEHGRRPARYRLVRAPALSWLVDRSFVWRTLAAEAGVMDVLVRREADGVAPDTLVLAVEVIGAGG